jgi:hypothetical protein
MGDEHMIFIFDIDGVLADVTHLLPLITGSNKDYELYYSRIDEAVPIIRGLRLNGGIMYATQTSSFSDEPRHLCYFVTGRREQSRKETTEWLYKNIAHHVYGNHKLYMRGDKDLRHAKEVKYDIIQTINKETGVPFNNMTVFEDDPQCAEMYESLGCYVCHVKHDKARS